MESSSQLYRNQQPPALSLADPLAAEPWSLPGPINYGLALYVASTNPTPHTTNKQHAAFPSYYGDELTPIMINSIMCNFMYYLYCMVIAQP